MIKSIFEFYKNNVRMTNRFSYYAPSEPIFHLIGILPIFKVYMYCIFIFMHKFNQGVLPEIFNDMFVRNAVFHEHYTRQSLYPHVPLGKTSTIVRPIKLRGVLLWNNVKSVIDTKCSIHTFMTNLKNHLQQTTIKIYAAQ